VPQLHFYVPEQTAKRLRNRAESRGVSLSKYIAEVVTHKMQNGWPQGYLDRVVGGWQGKPLKRPPQGEFEERDEF
jgi:hypothetical protein